MVRAPIYLMVLSADPEKLGPSQPTCSLKSTVKWSVYVKKTQQKILLWLVNLFIGNIETGQKEGKILGCHKASKGSKGHKGHILCLSITSDGKFLVREII